MEQLIQIISLALGILGTATGSYGLYLYRKELKLKSPHLAAWVLSTYYLFKEDDRKPNLYPDLTIQLEFFIQNRGGRDTTISEAFAEVSVGERTTHTGKGKIYRKETDDKLVSGPVSLPVGDSKTLLVGFQIENVDPSSVNRSSGPGKPLDRQIIVDFKFLNTLGVLEGRWAVCRKDQKGQLQIIRWLNNLRLKEGKPHWIQK